MLSSSAFSPSLVNLFFFFYPLADGLVPSSNVSNPCFQLSKDFVVHFALYPAGNAEIAVSSGKRERCLISVELVGTRFILLNLISK